MNNLANSKDILLVTLNSTYQHAAFGLRYLFANLGNLQDRTQILEYTIEKNPRDIIEDILKLRPKIVGFGVYIWNARQTMDVVSVLKRACPEILVVLGGPEVSYESEKQEICEMADFVIKGEADFLFREFCKKILIEKSIPTGKFISGPLPDILGIQSPYRYYSDADIKNRVIYIEASRGCPYKCEYCLSSLDKSVRNFPLASFLADLDLLIQRGTRQFKFIDRTFNLSIAISSQILQFFLERIELGLFLHFEMVPDRLPSELRDLIKLFPNGALQFEIGIQTWNPVVAKLVSRKNDYAKVAENFKFLSEETGVHTHADLIVGLPAENLESFALGFDKLHELKPDEIQVGILKRLKGTPIIRHDQEWQMVYQNHPPFQILSTKSMDYLTLQKMNRFAKFWDLVANSGHFPEFTKAVFAAPCPADNFSKNESVFWKFFELSNFLSHRHPQLHSIHLANLGESLFLYLTEILLFPENSAANIIFSDYCGKGGRALPGYLKPFIQDYVFRPVAKSNLQASAPERQSRHQQ